MAKVFTITGGLENLGALKSGGQGSVYKARRPDGTLSAVKILPTPVASESATDRAFVIFQNEVEKLKRVNREPNNHIVRILSSGITETGSLPYIEMEYIDGPDLEELLKPPYEPLFTIEEAIKLAVQVSDALAHCQKLGVVHGDMKPNNIKLNKATRAFVLLDFGMALMSDEQRRTSMRQAGAIEFMAPEQGRGKAMFSTDVYSFGVVLYEVLSGRVPFPLEGGSETARNAVMLAHMESPVPDLLEARARMLPGSWSESKKRAEAALPPWLVYTVEKCLAKNPDDRFVNAVALKEFIEEEREEFAAISQGGISRKRAHVEQGAPLIAPTVPDEARAKAVARKRRQVRRQSARRRRMSPAMFLVVFLVLTGLAYGAYSFFIKKDAAIITTAPSAGKPADEVEPLADGSGSERSGVEAEERATRPPADEEPVGAKVDPPTQVPKVRERAVSPPREERARKEDRTEEEPDRNTSVSRARYKVRSKAYFHNEPDESTRRAAFIIHWNNAILEPQREEDGFVYIVFTNHLGQTSRGWLRIKDLIKLED